MNGDYCPPGHIRTEPVDSGMSVTYWDPPKWEVTLPISDRCGEVGEEINFGHPSRNGSLRIPLVFADGGRAEFFHDGLRLVQAARLKSMTVRL